MRKILNLLRPQAFRLTLAIVASTLVSLMNAALAWLAKPTVDDLLVSTEGFYLLVPLGFFFVFFFRGIFEYSNNFLMKSIGAKIVRDLRNRTYAHMLHLPLSHYGEDSSGKMLSRLINDANILQDFVARRVRDLFVSTGTIIFLAYVAAYRSVELALISFILIPLAFYAVEKLGRRLKKVAKKAQQKIAVITESISEGLSGIKIIKSFQREDGEVRRFRSRNRQYYREQMRAANIEEFVTFLMDLTAGVGITAVLYYGGAQVREGLMTAGDFISFLASVLLIYTPAKRLAVVHTSLQPVSASIERIEEILDRPVEREDGREFDGLKNTIEMRRMTFSYDGSAKVLRDITLTVNKGDVVALVGKSGGGKTTFVDLLAGFYSVTEGSILFDGVDIAEYSLKSLRNNIGLVSQDVVLFNDTVRANILFGNPEASEEDMIQAARAAHAHDFIGELPQGYDTMIGERGVRLSGGQRQRLSIARAILKNPPILILDEATSSLDTESERLVQDALDTLMANRTTFVIAHRLSTVRSADSIVVIDGGRIVERGSHNELMEKSGAYRRLYNLQYWDGAEAFEDKTP